VSGFLRWAQRVFFAIAFVAFGYCAWVMTEAWIFQRQEDAALERLVVARETTAVDVSPEAPVAPPKPKKVPSGKLIGRIEVQRLGLSVVIVEGTDSSTLKRAAGHIAGTALPGQPGNVGIAAHRDTYFRPLRDIHKDDIITVTTADGDYRYKVVSTEIVTPDDVSVLDSDGTDVLTLVTCYPFNYIGAAPSRFIIRAEQIT
jgi:sortase A